MAVIRRASFSRSACTQFGKVEIPQGAFVAAPKMKG